MAGFAWLAVLKAELSTLPEPDLSTLPRHGLIDSSSGSNTREYDTLGRIRFLPGLPAIRLAQFISQTPGLEGGFTNAHAHFHPIHRPSCIIRRASGMGWPRILHDQFRSYDRVSIADFWVLLLRFIDIQFHEL